MADIYAVALGFLAVSGMLMMRGKTLRRGVVLTAIGFILPLLFLALYLTGRVTSLSWKSVCDDRLLPHILIAGGRKSGPLPLVLITLAASISIVALAGPVWKKLPQPVFREQ